MDRIHVLNRALEVIDHEPTHDLTAASLARRLGYSRSALDRLFVETLGDTPARHIRARRLRAAAHDLLNTRKRIVDIAFDAGFASQEAFTRAFSRVYRCTPDAYRRRAAPLPLSAQLSLRPHPFVPTRIRVVRVWPLVWQPA